MKTLKQIEITSDNWDEIVYPALEIAGIDQQFLQELKINLLQYIDYGYHYIGGYFDENEIAKNKMFIGNKLQSIVPAINVYLSYGLSVLGNENKIPKGTEINRHFESKGDGVGEISPINAIVGDITTPNSKTHSETKSDNTDKHTTVDDFIKSFRFSEKYKSLVSVVGELICNTIIAEFNTIY